MSIDVYHNGKIAFVKKTDSTANIDAWVHQIAKDSGQVVEWHYASCGCTVLKTTGDVRAVKASIIKNPISV